MLVRPSGSEPLIFHQAKYEKSKGIMRNWPKLWMPCYGTVTRFCINGEVSTLLQRYGHPLLLCVRPSLLTVVQPSAPAVIQSNIAIVHHLCFGMNVRCCLGVGNSLLWLGCPYAQRGSYLCSNVGCLSALAWLDHLHYLGLTNVLAWYVQPL